MKNTKNKLAFTLIELLVVITIIGILATGAVSVFTTQLQWARDSTRISDMKTIETALHQIFSDDSAYPAFSSSWEFKTKISPFISKTLKDPKAWKTICWEGTGSTDNSTAQCDWYYNSTDDSFWLDHAAFKLWVRFEKKTNYEQKAKQGWREWDGGSIDDMYEIYAGAGGSWISLPNTNLIY